MGINIPADGNGVVQLCSRRITHPVHQSELIRPGDLIPGKSNKYCHWSDAGKPGAAFPSSMCPGVVSNILTQERGVPPEIGNMVEDLLPRMKHFKFATEQIDTHDEGSR